MSKSASPKNFESALAEIESIVARMESGQLPLDEAIAAHKRGTELLLYCQKYLAEAEQQIRVLSENQTLQPFQLADD